MSLAAALLAPFAMLLPAANAVTAADDSASAGPAAPAGFEQTPALRMTPLPEAQVVDPVDSLLFELLSRGFRAGVENQVRIEQRITIRVAPRPSNVQPTMLMDLPAQAPSLPRFSERNMGKCLPVSGIAGVQVTARNRLVLYLRDRRVVSAALERACNARDFYSGFYVERSSDGQLCVNRDTLQSRSGANCKLSGIKQLVEVGN